MLTIYVSHASDCLTDHLPHGEGLLCFSWLKALASRGHKIHAYSPNASVKQNVPNLIIYKNIRRIISPSLKYWTYGWESNCILNKLREEIKVDLIWRMYPYSTTVPTINTKKIPLAIGPLYSSYNKINIEKKVSFGYKPHQFGSYLANIGWRRAISLAEIILTEDLKTVSDLKELYPKKNIDRLSAIIESKFRKIQRIAPDLQAILNIAFVGHFHPSKRLTDFCRIINLLRKEGLNVYGHVVGEGEELQKAVSYCNDVKIIQYLTFYGRIPNDDIYRLLSKMHFFLSLREESYGRAIVESMSVGTPVICVNKSGPADYISNGESGILLDDSSINSYVEVIIKLATDKPSWSKISNGALTKSANWKASVVVNKLEKIFYTSLKKEIF